MTEEYIFNVELEASEESFSPQLEFDNYSFIPDVGQVVSMNEIEHEDLDGRNKPNQHSISAITGLSQELNNINSSIEEVQTALETKQDVLSTGTGIVLNHNEISVDTEIIAQKSDIHNSTITVTQNGLQLTQFTLNQLENQVINLGRSGDWFRFIAIPFDDEGQLLHKGTPAYWKITSKDLIDTTTGVVTFYSGEEIQNIINNANCYVALLESLLFPCVALEFDFYSFADMDTLHGKVAFDTFTGQAFAYAIFSGHNFNFNIRLVHNGEYLNEGVAYKTSILESPDHNIQISSLNGTTYLDIDNIILDCGTSTINI